MTIASNKSYEVETLTVGDASATLAIAGGLTIAGALMISAWAVEWDGASATGT